MAGMLRKGMSWLGLGPDEDYDDYVDYDEFEDEEPVVDLTSGRRSAETPAVRPVPVGASDWEEGGGSAVRVLPGGRGTSTRVYPQNAPTEPAPRTSVVRPLPGLQSTKPHVVSPRAFNDAQEVGDWFRKRQPVILNLQGLDRDLARRLLDFSSGVAYGLAGKVEKIASHVYLLSPADVEVSSDERERLRSSGLYD